MNMYLETRRFFTVHISKFQLLIHFNTIYIYLKNPLEYIEVTLPKICYSMTPPVPHTLFLLKQQKGLFKSSFTCMYGTFTCMSRFPWNCLALRKLNNRLLATLDTCTVDQLLFMSEKNVTKCVMIDLFIKNISCQM